MNIYEMYGRQAEQLKALEDYYQGTQKLLAALVSGEIVIERLSLNGTGWMVKSNDEAGA